MRESPRKRRRMLSGNDPARQSDTTPTPPSIAPPKTLLSSILNRQLANSPRPARLNSHFVPANPPVQLASFDDRPYTGHFVADGATFLTATQGFQVKIFDSSDINDFKVPFPVYLFHVSYLIHDPIQ